MNFLKVNRYSTKKLKTAEVALESFQPGTIIIFLDKPTKQEPDESGCNQIGILLTNKKVLFVRNNRVIELSLTQLNSSMVFAIPFKSEEFARNVSKYFEANKGTRHLFKAGLIALKAENEAFFSSPIIMPQLKRYDSDETYEEAWNNLLPQIEKADMVCTFNEKSLMSRFIASLDKGTWSHSAMYMGNGQISEAITQGIVMRDISVYKSKHVHIGIYRLFDMTPQRAEKAIQRGLSLIGGDYSYRKAIRVGLRTIFRLKLDPSKPGDLTPNGTVYSGKVHLITYI